jgi:hypothetical protein
MHSITFIHRHSSGLSPSPHRLQAQWVMPPCGAEPRIELGPALQQADVLPTEPRRTIMSHAAPLITLVYTVSVKDEYSRLG